MTAFPGTPAIQNAIPMAFFGTDPFAAPGLGIIGGLIMMVGGILWLNRRAAAARARGEGYGKHVNEEQTASGRVPSFLVAMVPIVLVILFNYLFTRVFIPMWDTAYLAEPQYGATNIDAVRGIWSIISALIIAIVSLIVLNWKSWVDLKDSINKGTMGSLLPIFNTASEVGYGTVIASMAAFTIIRDAVVGISANPLISLAVAVNVLAGITGSASGGMSIALQTLGATYLEIAQNMGISPELLHRVSSMSSGGFDSLPHNGAVITLLAICRLTHKESYFDIFMVSVLTPVSALIVVLTLGTLFGSF
jgi:H+/gluconate symporter-like permease